MVPRIAYDTVLLEHAGGVSTLTLNRPPVNAVSPALMQDVLAALDALEAREATRCIVLTGSGTKAFSAGADLAGGPRAADEAVRFRDGEVPHRRRLPRRGALLGHEPRAPRALHRPQPHAGHAGARRGRGRRTRARHRAGLARDPGRRLRRRSRAAGGARRGRRADHVPRGEGSHPCSVLADAGRGTAAGDALGGDRRRVGGFPRGRRRVQGEAPPRVQGALKAYHAGTRTSTTRAARSRCSTSHVTSGRWS